VTAVGICHPSSEPTRLPKGVADRVAPLGCIFGALSPTVITSELHVSRYKGSTARSNLHEFV
jgi:hypothetical protein